MRRWGVLFLFALSAEAAVVRTERIEDLAAAAQLVARGTVQSVEAKWDRSHRAIYTYAQVTIAERFKGGNQRSVRVRQPGGEVGEIGQHVAGAAGFKTGEELVLFLEPVADEPATYTLVALSAGKVQLDDRRAHRQLTGLAAADAPGSLRTLGDDALGPREAFLARVRAACSRSGK